MQFGAHAASDEKSPDADIAGQRDSYVSICYMRCLLHACSSYSDSHDNLTNARALCARMNVDASTRVSRAWSAFDVDKLKFAKRL